MNSFGKNFANEDWIGKLSNYRNALEKGLLKIMAKMGISYSQQLSWKHAVSCNRISQSLIDEYFPSIKSALGELISLL